MKKNNYIHFIGLFIGISLLMILNPLSGYGESLPTDENIILKWAEDNLGVDPTDFNTDIKQIDNSYYSFVLNTPLNPEKSVYFILHDLKNGQPEQIVEYGYGTSLPYQRNIILDKKFDGIEPTTTSYFSPLESYWSYQLDDELIYVDASTGDILPNISEDDIDEIEQSFLTIDSMYTDSFLDETLIFDPYYNIDWLVGDLPTISLSEKDTKTSLKEGKSILYVGEKYNHKVKIAYPVIGYVEFNDITHYALYDFYFDVIRYVDSNHLENFGGFYLH